MSKTKAKGKTQRYWKLVGGEVMPSTVSDVNRTGRVQTLTSEMIDGVCEVRLYFDAFYSGKFRPPRVFVIDIIWHDYEWSVHQKLYDAGLVSQRKFGSYDEALRAHKERVQKIEDLMNPNAAAHRKLEAFKNRERPTDGIYAYDEKAGF